MLEKEVHKFTRDGIQKQNLVTGQKDMVTHSAFSKQVRYEKTEQIHFGDKPKELSKSGFAQRNSVKDSFRPEKPSFSSTAAPDEISTQSGQEQLLTQVKDTGRHTYSAARRTTAVIKTSSNAINRIRTSSKNKNLRKNKAGIKTMSTAQSLFYKAGAGGKRLAVRAANSAVDETGKNEETGLQAISKTGQYTRSAYRGAKNTHRAGKWAKSTKLGRAATKGVRYVATAIKGAVQQAVVHAVQLIKSPFVLQALLMGGGIFLIIMIVTNLLSGLLLGMTGNTFSANSGSEFSNYVAKLDSDFRNSVVVLKKQLAARDANEKISISGLENVNTSPDDMLILLSALNDFDTELSDDTKKLMQEYHRVLNVYTVERIGHLVDNDVGSGQHLESETVIEVQCYTAEQRMLSFQPDEQQAELMLSLFELHQEVEGSYSGTLKWPLTYYHSISSPYGERIDPITGELDKFHTAIDLPAPADTPILAADAGTVIFAETSGTYGNLVKLQHKDGLQTWYAHCKSFTVSVGDTVTAGQHIAGVGNTGRSTGPHLHFEVRMNGMHQNPMNYY